MNFPALWMANPVATLRACIIMKLRTVISLFVLSTGAVLPSAAFAAASGPPVITAQPLDQTSVKPGFAVRFTTRATGTTPLKYQWYFGGTSGNYDGTPVINSKTVSGNTSFSLAIAQSSLANVGFYYCNITNVDGSNLTSVVQLAFRGSLPSNITVTPLAANVTAGKNAVFTAKVDAGTPPFSYQWLFNGANITGATLAAYTVRGAKAASAGQYTVKVSNALGNVTSDPPAILAVNGTAPVITVQPVGQSVASGSTATFSVRATGSVPLTYAWYFDGGNVSLGSQSTLRVAKVSGGNVGNYTVVVANGFAPSNTSVPANLTLKGL
jgi:hypothetical protein